MDAVIDRRHALGLPAGSVRALHVLLIVGMVCAIVLIPTRTLVPMPPYLIYLLFIVLGHFFGSHGVTIGKAGHHPLYLPGGMVRLLIVLMLGGSIGYMAWQDPGKLQKQFEASLDELKMQPMMPLIVLGGFFLGVIVRMLLGREKSRPGFQDFEAWISIVALVLMGAAVIIHLIISPQLEETLSLPTWEGFLAGVVAFYFGERS